MSRVTLLISITRLCSEISWLISSTESLLTLTSHQFSYQASFPVWSLQHNLHDVSSITNFLFSVLIWITYLNLWITLSESLSCFQSLSESFYIVVKQITNCLQCSSFFSTHNNLKWSCGTNNKEFIILQLMIFSSVSSASTIVNSLQVYCLVTIVFFDSTLSTSYHYQFSCETSFPVCSVQRNLHDVSCITQSLLSVLIPLFSTHNVKLVFLVNTQQCKVILWNK